MTLKKSDVWKSFISHARILFICSSVSFMWGLGLWSLGYTPISVLFLFVCFEIFSGITDRRLMPFYVSLIIFCSMTFGWGFGFSAFQWQKNTIASVSPFLIGTWKHHITGRLDKKLYHSDVSVTFRQKIDTIDTYSTTSTRQNIWVFVEIPKNIAPNVGDTISYTAKVAWVYEWAIEWFEKYAWKEWIIWKTKAYVFSKVDTHAVSFLEKIQEKTEAYIFSWFPRDEASLILWITVWNGNLMTASMKKEFLLSGMTHILVVSGSNIAFVIVFLMFFLKYLPLRPWWRFLFIGIFVSGYTLLVGWEVPVLRASLMGIIAYISLAYGKRVSSISLLLGLSVLFLLFDPFLLLYDPGFGLSFSATLGILLFGKLWENVFRKWIFRECILPVFSLTFWATLWSLAAIIYYFGQFSIGSLLANIIVGPFIGGLLLLSVFYIFLGFAPLFFIGSFGILIYIGAHFIISIAHFFSYSWLIIIPENIRAIISLMLLGCMFFFILKQEFSIFNSLQNQKAST